MEKFYGDPPPMHQSSYNGAKLEFHQDAILDGRLIHASNKDSSKITHPLFFEKLMKVCRPLDYFFHINQINFKPDTYDQDNSLLLDDCSYSPLEQDNNYILIVDQRSNENTNLEIIKESSLTARAYEYGHSDCFYFKVSAKWPSLSIDSVKDYFSSSIGKQIIDLTFNNEQTKVKRNLAKLLLPIFFAQNENLPEHIGKGISLLELSTEDILTKHPKELEREFTKIDFILNSIATDYPGQVFASIARFRASLERAIEMLQGQGKNIHINFNNPVIKSPLLLTKKYPIYPNNKEVFIQFDNSSLGQIHQPLTKFTLESEIEHGEKVYYINLHSGDDIIVSIYSSEEMIYFIQFLLSQVINVPISAILQGVKVPTIEGLKQVLGSYTSLKSILEQISSKLPIAYNRLINSIISQ